jgi:hypothetical protein
LSAVAAYKERSPTVGVELGDAVMRPGSPKIMAGDDEISVSIDGANSPEIHSILILRGPELG